jgi:hypothetical protein
MPQNQDSVRLLEDAADVALAVEDVEVLMLSGAALAGEVGAAEDELH